MYEVIRLGGRDVPMAATAATPVYYKTAFNDDLLMRFGGSDGDGDAGWIGRLAYIMAMQGAGADMKTVSEQGYVEWLDGFDPLDVFGVEESEKFVTLFGRQQEATVSPKKKAGERNGE